MAPKKSAPPMSLVERAKKDERVALQLWQDYFQDLAIGLALRYRFSQEEAEDATAVAREKFCTRLCGLIDNHAVTTWCNTLIVNTYRDLQKGKGREVSFEEISQEFPSNEAPSIELEEKEALEKRAEFFQIVKGLIEQLKPTRREIVAMHYLEGKSLVEISEKLGINYRTVAASSSKGIEELQSKIRRELIKNPAFKELIFTAFGEEGLNIIHRSKGR